MEQGRTVLTEAVRSVQLLKIDGYCATDLMDEVKFKWNVDGHEWEVNFYPNYYYNNRSKYPWLAAQLILASEPRRNELKVNLSCGLLDTSHRLDPSAEMSRSHVFPSQDGCTVVLIRRDDITSSGYLVNDSLTVQCTITVLKDLTDIVIPASNTEAPPLPPSDLHRHLGELCKIRTGADVTFCARVWRPFSRAQNHSCRKVSCLHGRVLRGQEREELAECEDLEDMDSDVFKAMLHFIYTDTAPELDEEPDVAVTMAQHLLAAADRYGLERLKLICEIKLAGGISIDTVATTLALAEQHKCSLLKAKCVDFIARSPETLDAVLETEGYNHLFESCPLVVTQLLKAVHGRRIDY